MIETYVEISKSILLHNVKEYNECLEEWSTLTDFEKDPYKTAEEYAEEFCKTMYDADIIEAERDEAYPDNCIITYTQPWMDDHTERILVKENYNEVCEAIAKLKNITLENLNK